MINSLFEDHLLGLLNSVPKAKVLFSKLLFLDDVCIDTVQQHNSKRIDIIHFLKYFSFFKKTLLWLSQILFILVHVVVTLLFLVCGLMYDAFFTYQFLCMNKH